MMRTFCSKVSLRLIVIPFMLLLNHCADQPAGNRKTSGDTIIILDPFSSRGPGETGAAMDSTVAGLLRKEIENKFQKAKKSQERILISYGRSEQNEMAIFLPDSLRALSGFVKFDKAVKRFADFHLTEIAGIIRDHPDDQSAFFAIFGYNYLSRNFHQNAGKIILVGNLVDKSFEANLAIKKSDFENEPARKEIDDRIDEKFKEFRAEFDGTFARYKEEKNARAKPDISLHLLRRELAPLVYDDRVHYDNYISLVKDFLKEYDRDGKIETNEY